MFSLETAIKNLIADAIVLAYEKIQDGNKDIAPADGEKESVVEQEAPAPSQKRARRTKAEMEAAAKAPEKGAPAFDYKTLQEVVLDYVLQNGKPAAEKILGQFGVSKAQDLQPEQWLECYDLFKAASEEAIA